MRRYYNADVADVAGAGVCVVRQVVRVVQVVISVHRCGAVWQLHHTSTAV